MRYNDALNILKTWKYFSQADFYFQSQTRMSIASYAEEYDVSDLKQYLIPDWKKGMDNLYYDYEHAQRKKRFQWALATAGHYGEDALKEAESTGPAADDGWVDE